MDNKTEAAKILIPIQPSSNFIIGKNLVGREGYEVVVLDTRGGGRAYVRTLHPGQGLNWGETIFGQYEAWAVDVRPDQKLVVEHRLTTVDHTTSLGVRVTLNYRVSDPYVVACLARDAVGGLYDRVVGALANVMQVNDYARIDERVCRSAVSRVSAQDLGIEISHITLVEVDYTGPAQAEAQHTFDLQQSERQQELNLFQDRATLARQLLLDGYHHQRKISEMRFQDAQQLGEKEQAMLLEVVEQLINKDLADGAITQEEAQQKISEAIDHLHSRKAKLPAFEPLLPDANALNSLPPSGRPKISPPEGWQKLDGNDSE